jgi:fumarate hydratase class II
MGGIRAETDSLGPVDVPAERLWGAQTERALRNFRMTEERMPREIVLAIAEVKRVAAMVNRDLGLLEARKADAIARAAEEVIEGRHEAEFPLSVWQTGSGTQTNMNVNEVLANRASEILGGPRGTGRLVHPNDEVNLGQSSNDVFPTAMHLAACALIVRSVLPPLAALRGTLDEKAGAFADVVKLGRTHLQDATPLTLGQEISGWSAQLAAAEGCIRAAMPGLHALAIGGTAVGTGLNAHPEFGARLAAALAERSGLPFVSAPNKFAALAGHEPLVAVHGALKTLAVALHKIANDVRWLASGPRGGIGEIRIPANEPGSSIMPGKVNPTQAEALVMVCLRVLGNDVAITMGAASGNFELNVCRPLIAQAFLQSARLLAGAMADFDEHCARGIEADRARIAELLGRSLMLVTALTPHIGYDKAAKIAQKAHAEGSTLREAALALGFVSAADFDRWST